MQHGQVAVQAHLGVEERPSNHGHALVAFYQGVQGREPPKAAQQGEEEEVGGHSFHHQQVEGQNLGLDEAPLPGDDEARRPAVQRDADAVIQRAQRHQKQRGSGKTRGRVAAGHLYSCLQAQRREVKV